jgi:hypothetical protein
MATTGCGAAGAALQFGKEALLIAWVVVVMRDGGSQ